MKNKIKSIVALLVLMIPVVPGMIYASGDNFTRDDRIEASSTQQLTLESAEIMLMMENRGELYSSHIIHNLNNEEVFIITIKEDELLKTYLIEQSGSMELVEESRI